MRARVCSRSGGRHAAVALTIFSFAALAVAVAPPAFAFVTFETGQARPLALSPDGDLLFACNTPDNALEIFDVTVSGLDHLASIPVGLEPSALAVRGRCNGDSTIACTSDTPCIGIGDEICGSDVWVVNHLSDSVSIVDVSDVSLARVVRTLLVGDEPRDIVFGGTDKDRAFITTAHRGQNTPLQATIETVLTTGGMGRADVWVFDANNLGATLEGVPLTTITLFADTPRALAVTPDGATVYAAAFHSGNQTATVNEGLIPDGCESNGGLPEPCTDSTLVAQPEVGLIVRFDGAQWLDELGRDWSSAINFDLPDEDVFVIDANGSPPAQVAGPSGVYAGVGTVLFNMAVNPLSGKVYVSNTEAFNEVRFEGPGTFAAGFKPVGEPATVRGHLAESRITVLDAGSVTPIHLNKHIDYSSCCDPIPNTENDNSLAFPLEMAVTSNGATLYVAALGSSKIGIFDTADLESDSFIPSDADHIEVTGGGPTGLILDEANGRLYTLTRFDNSISIISTGTNMQTDHIALHNPEPDVVKDGRRFLYDARFTSAHGDSACASCHIFGDFDSLAWDLGNPDTTTLNNPGPIPGRFDDEDDFGTPDFRALKGPMTTQSLRGMDNHGAMHWRGDRTGGNDAKTNQPNEGAFDEQAAFKKFNVAFEGLLGRSEVLTDADMQAFTDFMLEVMYPPNPIRNLDGGYTTDQLAGRDFFFDQRSDRFFACDGCHRLILRGNQTNDVKRFGFFGTRGDYTPQNESQFFKVPHLRNLYQKIGMFGMPSVPFVEPGSNGFAGDQVRGFGFLHDGSIDTVFRFLRATVFTQGAENPDGFPDDTTRNQVAAFMHAFPTNHAAIVGQQITRTSTSGAAVDTRIDLMLDRKDSPNSDNDPDDANVLECEVVAKGMTLSPLESRGYVYAGSGNWQSDRHADGLIADATLRALANTSGQELTFTAVPVGEGLRIGVDKDADGYRDADETDAGSDPADPQDFPCNTTGPFDSKDTIRIKDKKGQLVLSAKMMLGTYTLQTLGAKVLDGDGVFYAGSILGTQLELNGSGTTWKFTSNTGPITKAQVKVVQSTPGLFKVKLKTKGAWPLGSADETPATTFVTLDVGGECLTGNAEQVDID